MNEVKRELRGAGKEVARELIRVSVVAVFEWLKSRPLKRLRARRAARREDEQGK